MSLRSSGARRPRRPAAALTLAVALAAAAPARSPAGAEAAGAPPPVPAGYRVAGEEALAAGVDHVELRRVDDARDPQVVHVARMRPSDRHSLRVVLAEDRLGRVERPDAMCLRVGCIAAVNGDFYTPSDDLPVGAVVVDGQMLKSPAPTHHQLSIAPDGTLATGTLEAAARFVTSDLGELRADGLNVERLEHRLVLYTPAHGPTTGTNAFGVEVTARVVEPAPPLRLGQTALVELVEMSGSGGNAPIPTDGLVLSGHGDGGARLAELWRRASTGEVGRRGLLRLEVTPPAAQSIGGSPVLVREGRRWVGDDGSGFVNGRHPRTIVGWTAAGEVLLVTVDGRQPGYSGGLTLPEAAELMIGLGAVEAINLDGGGSTAFVTATGVRNQPSDRLVRRGGREQIVHVPRAGDTVVGNVQRPVAVALAIVARAQAGRRRGDLLARASPNLPVTAPVAASVGDPGSVPDGTLPALVTRLPDPPPVHLWLLLAVTVTGVAASAGTAVTVRARWRRRLARAVDGPVAPGAP